MEPDATTQDFYSACARLDDEWSKHLPLASQVLAGYVPQVDLTPLAQVTGAIESMQERMLREIPARVHPAERLSDAVYIAGPYNPDYTTRLLLGQDRFTAIDHGAVRRAVTDFHVARAEYAGVWFMRYGYNVVIPHKNTQGLERLELEHEHWVALGQNLLERCEYAYFLPGYANSLGSMQELYYAIGAGVCVWPQLTDVAQLLSRVPGLSELAILPAIAEYIDRRFVTEEEEE